MIIVTGATGQLGSLVVARLLDRLPADRVAVSVRDPGRATDLRDRGVRVRRGDYAEPASLAEAFRGAEQVLVVSSTEHGAAAVDQHAAAVDAARAAGARRVVYTSHQASSAESVFGPMPDHAATEKHLASAGIPFTSLRNGFYAASAVLLLGPALRTGEIVAPADGPVSWTAHADLAEAAATVLAEEGRLDGITPPLTAPDAHDLDDIARILTALTGRTVRRTVVADEEWTAGLVARGVPADRADFMLGLFRAARRGEFAATDPTLGTLLGRPVTPLRTVLEAAVRAG